MELPDFSAVCQRISGSLPEVMYSSVEEAAAANRQRMEANIAYFRENRSELDRHLDELNEEWDVVRVLEVVAGGATVASFWLSLTKTRLFLLVPLVLGGCALQHGLTGQSPAVDMARRLGFRTRDEIEDERTALQGLRGDVASAQGTPA